MTSKNETKASDKSFDITHAFGVDKVGLTWLVVILGYYIPNTIGQWISSSPKGFWESKYEALYYYFGGNELYILSIGAVVVHLVGSWSMSITFTLIDLTEKPSFIYKYKIKDKNYHKATYSEILHLSKQCLFNQIFVSIPYSTAAYFILKSIGCQFDIDGIPDLKTTLFQMLIHLIVFDISFHYTHVFLHIPFFYRHIHKKHHEWKSPVALTSFYFHPLDLLLSVLLPVFLGGIVTKCHASIILLWVYVGINLGVLEHIGYKFPLYPSPQMHTLHHQTFTEFYGASGVLDSFHKTNMVKKNVSDLQ